MPLLACAALYVAQVGAVEATSSLQKSTCCLVHFTHSPCPRVLGLPGVVLGLGLALGL